MTTDEIIEQALPVNLDAMVGVYFLLDGNEIVYVGQSRSNIPARVQCHAKDKVFQRFTVMPCPVSDLDYMEASFIAKYAPKYNRVIKGNSSIKGVGIMPNIDNCKGIAEVACIGGNLYILMDTIKFENA